ncbi:phosphoribosyltransferase family protein [Actinomadura scrupuli]|uniref:phosphoribosyltransferase family protein n=1 Tax=Actinomadura scrupuli TaxID=559629 RepID=UPI003D95F5EE
MFIDRVDAGRRLAERLGGLRAEDLVVLGLPRGGVPVAYEIARALGAPLDVIVVRKLGVPRQPELAMGALGEGGVRIVNDDIVRRGRISADDLAVVQAREQAELRDRDRRFRRGRPRVPLAGRTALIVDDGVATGSTARAACRVARAQGAKRVVLAVPVGDSEVIESLRGDADEVICLEEPGMFYAVGEWYENFAQVPDEAVVALLAQAPRPHPERVPGPPPEPLSRWEGDTAPAGLPARDEEVSVDGGTVELAGHLTVPEKAQGIVVFVHGSGSSRHSPRNRYVAEALNEAGLGTLLFDLLTPVEEADRANVFDIPLLATRLTAATRWLRDLPETADARIGYFGASTGAAAALWAAAEPGAGVAAVVSRGGRPDLAGHRLSGVRAPTLLIVGGDDPQVLDLNHQAQRQLRCENGLTVVPGATHLFGEPGALENVAGQARDWFLRHLN